MMTKSDRAWGFILGILASALAVSIAIWTSGCATLEDGSTGPNWAKIDVAGDEILLSLERRGADDDILAAMRALDSAVDAVIEGGDPANVWSLIDTLTVLVDAALAGELSDNDRELMEDVREVLALIRIMAA